MIILENDDEHDTDNDIFDIDVHEEYENDVTESRPQPARYNGECQHNLNNSDELIVLDDLEQRGNVYNNFDIPTTSNTDGSNVNIVNNNIISCSDECLVPDEINSNRTNLIQ